MPQNDKLCCATEQRTDSPLLPNAREAQPISKTQSPPTKKRENNASQSLSSRPEDLQEMQMLISEAQAEANKTETPTASPGRSNTDNPKGKGLKTFVKHRLMRGSKSTFSLLKKSQEHKAKDTELQEKKQEIREGLLTTNRPEEGGYDSDAASLPDVRNSLVDRLTRDLLEENSLPAKGRTQVQRMDVQSIDWTGPAPTLFSWPGSDEVGLALTKDQTPRAGSPSRVVSAIGIIPSFNNSTDNVQAEVWAPKCLQRSRSESIVGDLPSPPLLKPTRLPSLSSSVNTRIMRLSADSPIHHERYETPSEEFPHTHSTVKNATTKEEDLSCVKEDGEPVAGPWPTFGSTPDSNESLPESSQDLTIEPTDQSDIETPKPPKSPARKACIQSAELKESEAASLHLYQMRISQHLRTDSVVTMPTGSQYLRTDSFVCMPAGSQPLCAEDLASMPAGSQYFRTDSFVTVPAGCVTPNTANYVQPRVSDRRKSQRSSSNFGSSKVPSTWGNVVNDGEVCSFNGHAPADSLYQTSSVYSTRPNSPDPSDDAAPISSSKVRRNGYEIVNLADVASIKPDQSNLDMPGRFPVTPALVGPTTKPDVQEEEEQAEKVCNSTADFPLKVDSESSDSSALQNAPAPHNAPDPEAPSIGPPGEPDLRKRLTKRPFPSTKSLSSSASKSKFSAFSFFRPYKSHGNLKQPPLIQLRPIASPSLTAFSTLNVDCPALNEKPHNAPGSALGLDGPTEDLAADPLAPKPGWLHRAWALGIDHDEHPASQAKVWQRALEAHQKEKSALFLSPEQGGRSKKNAEQNAEQSLFRPRSGSVVAKQKDKERIGNKNDGLEVPDMSPVDWFATRRRSKNHNRASIMLDPLEREIAGHSKTAGITPAASPGRLSKESLTAPDEGIEDPFFGDDSKFPLGAWSRYPSHTRAARTASAGEIDLIRARDFAYELRLSDIADETPADSDADDDQQGSKNKGKKPRAPTAATNRTMTPLAQRKGKYKSRIGTVSKSKSMTFGRNFLRNYVRIFRSQSDEFRRWGHGHRSSIAEGGVLEHPELEILPSVWSAGYNAQAETKEEQDTTDKVTKSEAEDAENSDPKPQVDGTSGSTTTLPPRFNTLTNSQKKATLVPGKNQSAPSLRRRWHRAHKNSDSEWKAEARLLLQAYDTEEPSGASQKGNGHSNSSRKQKGKTRKEKAKEKDKEQQQAHVPESSREWRINARIWTRFADAQSRKSEVVTPAASASLPAKAIESTVPTSMVPAPVPTPMSTRVKTPVPQPLSAQSSSPEPLRLLSPRLAAPATSNPAQQQQQQQQHRSARPSGPRSSSEEWRSDARLFSQFYENCLDPYPLFGSSGEDGPESPIACATTAVAAAAARSDSPVKGTVLVRGDSGRKATALGTKSLGRVSGGAGERVVWRSLSGSMGGNWGGGESDGGEIGGGGGVERKEGMTRGSTVDFLRVLKESEEKEKEKAIREAEGLC